jgi:hypothetical protein
MGRLDKEIVMGCFQYSEWVELTEYIKTTLRKYVYKHESDSA